MHNLLHFAKYHSKIYQESEEKKICLRCLPAAASTALEAAFLCLV